MSDKCRRYVADPNIKCFRASYFDAIVFGRKYSDFIVADVMGWCGNCEFIGHLSASFVCTLYMRFDPGWHGLRVKLSVLRC